MKDGISELGHQCSMNDILEDADGQPRRIVKSRTKGYNNDDPLASPQPNYIKQHKNENTKILNGALPLNRIFW